MKCFSIFEGKKFYGIKVSVRSKYDQKLGRKRKQLCVRIGRGCYIDLFNPNTPTIDERGLFYDAFTYQHTGKQSKYFLAKPNKPNDRKALVHILSESPWEVEDGRPQIIARCEYVEAARRRSEWKKWYSGLVVLRDVTTPNVNDALYVELEKGPAVIWYEDGELLYELLHPADAMEPEIGSSPELLAEPNEIDPDTGYPGFAPVRIEDVLYDK